MVSLYSHPHKELYEYSFQTLLSCTYAGEMHSDLWVIDAKLIKSVVAMVPHNPFPGETLERYFVVEKPGLDVACLGEVVEVAVDEE